MKRFLAALVLSPWLTLSAWPQTISFQPPLSQVRQFLGLTDDQVSIILQNNKGYNDFSFQQRQMIQQAQSQISVETAKDSLDPMTIGNLYASIETTCRALRDKGTTVQQQNISALTDLQKSKLSMLNDAMKLIPTISDAQSGNLLGSADSPPFFISAGDSGTATFSIGYFPGVQGCGVNVSGVLGGIVTTLTPSPAQTDNAAPTTTPPAGPNRMLDHWFDRTDFYTGAGFQKLIKPESKPE